ncbi:InlB B-repeat-containing protein [Candidatus Saccharibacteria bacterium]|nr:InlB B-repeat-containing protein [Candidatus Saccharibacteria bacterium]
MPINKSNIKPFACRVTRINGTRNKSITNNLARKGLKLIPIVSILSLGIYLTSMPTHAATTLHFTIDSNPSMTITLQDANNTDLSDNSSTLSINPTTTGAFNSQNINILVGTNNYSGYELRMSTMNTTSLVSKTTYNNNGVNENYTIDTIPTKSNGYTLAEFSSTDGTELANSTMNKWGYMIASTSLAANQYTPNFNPLSTSGILINEYSETTGSNPHKTTITFGAKLNNELPSGQYDGTIVFVATAKPNPTCYDSGCTINYDSNGVNSTTTMAAQTVTSGTSSVMLWPSNFKNPAGTTSTSGYGFAGWNTKADGTGINYGPMETIDTNTIYAGGVTLYAKWIQSTADMQGWNGCSSMSVGQVTALRDNRDNNVYAVAKLADEKCWMIENLRLGSSATLSSSNTNNPILPLTQADGTTANHLSIATNIYSDFTQIDTSTLDTTNTTATINQMADTTQAVYSYGNYYNWYSATAGRGSSFGTKNASTDGDICPASWRVPSGGGLSNENFTSDGDTKETNEWYILGSHYINGIASGNGIKNQVFYNIGNKLRAYPNNMIASGSVYHRSSSYNRGIGTALWSRTTVTGEHAYNLSIVNDAVYLGNFHDSGSKYLGLPVRCLASN